LVGILTLDGFFGSKFHILTPRWLPTQIAAQFARFDVDKSRGGYTLLDRRTSSPVARLRPIPSTDRFELFYWSNAKGRWTTFGNIGRLNLMIESAHEIVENDPIFRIQRSQ